MKNILDVIVNKIEQWFACGKRSTSFLWHQVLKRPLVSLCIVLVLLFVLIAFGTALRKPQVTEDQKSAPKKVSIYQIGTAPKITVSAKVEKSGSIKIVALTPGIISQINISEGSVISRGQTIVSMGSTYSGVNAASVQRQIAQSQYNQQQQTLEDQKVLIQKQKDLAEKNQENVDEQRKILQSSLDDTRRLIDLNTEVINSINSNITHLQDNNPGGQNDQLIAGSQAQRASFESALTQLRSQLKQNEYQTVGENPPGRAAFIQKEVLEKQLDLQEKTLTFGLEITGLQIKLAQISESMFFPTAPFSGTIERVFVKVGQNVQPGTPLALLSGGQGQAKAIALMPQAIAQSISKLEPSTLTVKGQNFEVIPDYVSTEATDGQLYSVTFFLPEKAVAMVTDGTSVTLTIPIGYAQSGSTLPFVPLDAIFQSTNTSFVFINENGIAKSRTIKIGSIEGSFAQVLDGLHRDDQIIMNRNVISQDTVVAE